MLTRLNEIVYEDVNEEMFLTLFYSTYIMKAEKYIIQMLGIIR